MKTNVLAVFFILVLSLVIPKKASSQIMEVGATVSAPYYVGDLNPYDHFFNVNPSFGVSLRYYQGLRWAFRFQYSHYNLQIQPTDELLSQKPFYGDKEQYTFPLNKEIGDFALLTEFNFFEYWTGSNLNYVTPYIFTGLSSFGYGFSLPFGVGVKYSVYQRLGMTLEWRMNKTFSDDIDNVNDMSGDFDFWYDRDWIGALELSIIYRFNLPQKSNCHSGIITR